MLGEMPGTSATRPRRSGRGGAPTSPLPRRGRGRQGGRGGTDPPSYYVAMAWADVADRDLVAAVRNGDSAAWDRLVERFGGRVWAVARAHRLSQADA